MTTYNTQNSLYNPSFSAPVNKYEFRGNCSIARVEIKSLNKKTGKYDGPKVSHVGLKATPNGSFNANNAMDCYAALIQASKDHKLPVSNFAVYPKYEGQDGIWVMNTQRGKSYFPQLVRVDPNNPNARAGSSSATGNDILVA